MILQRLGVPIYLQVKNYIMDRIKTGEFPVGSKIPTERELAQRLSISRNTVSAAYKELLLEGVLEARQGKGTFVRQSSDELSNPSQEFSGSRSERVLKIIDEAIAKAVGLGFTVDQFIALAGIRAKEKAEEVKHIRIAIVDHTSEYISHYITQISQAIKGSFEGVVLQELLDGTVPIELLHACDVVVTGIENQALVTGLMGGSSKIMVVSIVPNLESVVRLARLPSGTKAGIVASTSGFAESLGNLMTRTMIENVSFDAFVDAGDREKLRQFVGSHEVLVVAEERENLVRQLALEGQNIITFYYEIDQGSLNQLVARMIS